MHGATNMRAEVVLQFLSISYLLFELHVNTDSKAFTPYGMHSERWLLRALSVTLCLGAPRSSWLNATIITTATNTNVEINQPRRLEKQSLQGTPCRRRGLSQQYRRAHQHAQRIPVIVRRSTGSDQQAKLTETHRQKATLSYFITSRSSDVLLRMLD